MNNLKISSHIFYYIKNIIILQHSLSKELNVHCFFTFIPNFFSRKANISMNPHHKFKLESQFLKNPSQKTKKIKITKSETKRALSNPPRHRIDSKKGSTKMNYILAHNPLNKSNIFISSYFTQIYTLKVNLNT